MRVPTRTNGAPSCTSPGWIILGSSVVPRSFPPFLVTGVDFVVSPPESQLVHPQVFLLMNSAPPFFISIASSSQRARLRPERFPRSRLAHHDGRFQEERLSREVGGPERTDRICCWPALRRGGSSATAAGSGGCISSSSVRVS